MGAPNVLLIMADQHRYDCLGYSRDYPVRTPYLDRLAQEGAWFERAFTPTPICCPARQAMLACRRPERFGALWNSGFLGVRSLEPTEWTWTRALEAAGYEMGFIGKWSINPSFGPTDFGYGDYVDDAQYREFRSAIYAGGEPLGGWFGATDPILLQASRTHWYADQAVHLLERYAQGERPWHISLNFHEPHLPCCPSEPYANMYEPDEVPEWRSFSDTFEGKPFIQLQQLYNWQIEGFGWRDWAPVVARYYGIISQVDDAVGRVLAALSRLGQDGNTIVIYTSDHGDMCGGHRMMDKHYVMYEDVVKVPFIIKWPGVVKPGTRVPEFVYNCLDLGPTLLESLGLPPRAKLDGRSLLPLMKRQVPPDWREAVVSTYNGQQFGLYSQRMLRDERWKYIWNCTDIDELYDLDSDPSELTNLACLSEHQERLSQMRTCLYGELRSVGDDLVGTEWMRDQLLLGRKAPAPVRRC